MNEWQDIITTLYKNGCRLENAVQTGYMDKLVFVA